LHPSAECDGWARVWQPGYNKRLSRFTLRGKAKGDGQFKLYAMMYSIEKYAGSGYARRDVQ
jgi:hypothetical protein